MSILWFQDRDKLISHKGNKSLPVYGPCSCTTELNALWTCNNNGRYPRAPRSWKWSLNSPSSWTTPVVPYNSPVLQLNAITLMIPTWFSWFLKLTTPFDNLLLKISQHFSYRGALNALSLSLPFERLLTNPASSMNIISSDVKMEMFSINSTTSALRIPRANLLS